MAEMFSLYLDHPVEPHDVALIEILQKVVRLKQTRGLHMDIWIDIAGYAAIGAETASESHEVRQSLELIKERICAELGVEPLPEARGSKQKAG
jgi:6-phosphogluconate dehydrogenase